eukprot:scaffold13756_cov148-Skeletonema_dohrnii-CCMP3373.AAC.1
MGEAPRARITAQNTLTTWHADRLYGAMSSTVNSGENGNQRNHLSEILQSPHYNVADVFTRRLLPQHLELYIHTDNVAVNHAERSRFLSSRRRAKPALTGTLYGNSFADRQSHLYLDDVVFTRTYRYTDDETIKSYRALIHFPIQFQM